MPQSSRSDNALLEISKIIRTALESKPFVLVGIDGRSGSGKTTLAQALAEMFECTAVHADDFFLQSFQRTTERLSEAGGNMDRERLEAEVLIPLRQKGEAAYRPFDCSVMDFKQTVCVKKSRVGIVEGTYCCHPELWDYYDLRVFVTCDEHTQRCRILNRNGDYGEIFFKKWIPLEEKYFAAFDIEKRCDMTAFT